jgi:hypothetical protein
VSQKKEEDEENLNEIIAKRKKNVGKKSSLGRYEIIVNLAQISFLYFCIAFTALVSVFYNAPLPFSRLEKNSPVSWNNFTQMAEKSARISSQQSRNFDPLFW